MFNQPFPLNESFKPPTPLSDALKSTIYNAFAAAVSTHTDKSESYHVRQLSARYGLSLDRIRAIVRLKALEANTTDKSLLQHKFNAVMESTLGVQRGPSLEDVEKKIQLDPSTGYKANWLMIDEENPQELEEIHQEVTQRKEARARNHTRFVDAASMLQEKREQSEGRSSAEERVKGGEIHSIPASEKSWKREKGAKLEFVDVGGRRSQQ